MKVLITGASRGLGSALVNSFWQDHHYVVAVARSFKGWVPLYDAAICEGDVTDDAFLASLIERHPDCDVLINNAGVGFDGLLPTQSIDSIDRLLDTNLRSALVLSKLFARAHLGNGTSGTIVNISSICAKRGYAGLAAYSASKAGLIGLTQTLARELGPKGFRVNAVLPGFFDSDMTKKMPDKQRQQIIRRTPLGRLGTVEDIVPVVRFLCSDDARFITGQCITVDGGSSV